MQTSIVYVLTSTDKDLYLEQLWLSLYSLRLYHPNANVILLTDDRTEATLVGNRAKIKQYLTEVKVVDVPENYSPKERSRYIKTRFRKYLRGNLLFLDTDTIIADDLSAIDEIESEIACVLDYHALLDELVDSNVIRKRIHTIFGLDVSNSHAYFNSGVMFVKDTPKVHHLFDVWQKKWEYAAFVQNECYDQPALLVADNECGQIISEMSGCWNCQILTSIQYLHRAKIIHFFNNAWEGKSEFSPFFCDTLYRSLKSEGEISDVTKSYIKDVRSAFYSPTYFTCKKKYEFLSSLSGATLYSGYKKNSCFFRMISCLCSIRYFFIKLFAHD